MNKQSFSSNKNFLVIGAMVLLLGGAAFVFKHQIKTLFMPQAPVSETTPVPMPAPAPTGAVMEKVEVDYTNSGFSPKTITIKKGTTVKFVNKSDNKMDVASDPHPIHTNYPAFDQWKSSQKGQNEYDFTFEKVGSWGYHNHLNPSDTGTVIVTE